jgi:hypothetical protein
VDPKAIVLGFPALHEQVKRACVNASLGSGWTLIGYAPEDVALGWSTRVKLLTCMDPSANGASCFLDTEIAQEPEIQRTQAGSVGCVTTPSLWLRGDVERAFRSPRIGNTSKGRFR